MKHNHCIIIGLVTIAGLVGIILGVTNNKIFTQNSTTDPNNTTKDNVKKSHTSSCDRCSHDHKQKVETKTIHDEPTPLPSTAPVTPAAPAKPHLITNSGIKGAKQVDALPNNLSADVVTELKAIINTTGGDALLRNNIANKLIAANNGKHIAKLASDLTRMASDERETPKWRNYCVQHLYSCYEAKQDQSIFDALHAAAESNEVKVRITAVWGLARIATLQKKTSGNDASGHAKIHAAALTALREKDAHFLITTAGVQSCARLGLKEALPTIRALAKDAGTTPKHLRVVSLAALGDLGDKSDIALLDKVTQTEKGQLKGAATHAAKKIQIRTDN